MPPVVSAVCAEHAVEPTCCVGCVHASAPHVTEELFLAKPALGCVAYVARSAASAQAVLRHYRHCKQDKPSLSGLFYLPAAKLATWSPLLKSMTCVAANIPTHQLFPDDSTLSFTSYALFIDTPGFKKGAVYRSALPSSVQ